MPYRQRLHLIADLFVNLFLPWLVYEQLAPGHGEFMALVASSLPPLLWSLVELAWHRRIDALSMLVLGGIVLSLAAMALGGDARLLLVRESLISGLVGLLFLVSLLCPRPLVYYLALATMTRQSPESAKQFLTWWQAPATRSLIRRITLTWGIVLSGEALLRSYCAWHWPPAHFLAVMPFVSYAMMGALIFWNVWYLRRFKRQLVGRSDWPGADRLP